ncbi:WbqC family protein [Streptomyces sp. AC512_CC834]|uniref:WbqC family protein n=1 Tax=Streptomyces sp. AC512_CC834 TaxID=2823691 RepID=UPI001C260E49|nr:WbqC family protein [Streptomyces sp. AC512_CC834]
MQFTRRNYQHRTRPGALDHPGRRQWLTTPTRLPHGQRTLIRDALIHDPDRACRKTAGMLRQHYGASPYWPALAHTLAPVLDAFGTVRTATVAEISTRVLLGLLGRQGKILVSSDLPSRPGRSQRLADLCAITGARTYVRGTGGMTYLDPEPFAAEGIAVLPFRPPTTSIRPAGRSLSSLWALAALGPQEVAAGMRQLALDHGLVAAAHARGRGEVL